MSKITVDDKACILCGACASVCASAHVYDLGTRTAVAARPEACWGCGQCVSVCPVDAIDHDDFPLDKCPPIDERHLPSVEDLVHLFRSRRSNRTFSDRDVSRELIRELVSIGRWAPTAGNNQGIDWIAIDDRTRIAELSQATVRALLRAARLARAPFVRFLLRLILGKDNARAAARSLRGAQSLADRARDGGDPIFYRAPVVLVGHTKRKSPFSRDDAIYAAYNIMLAAERHGLATCQIGLFQLPLERSRKLRRAVPLPEGRSPQVCLVLGYPQYQFRRVVLRRTPDLVWNPR
ncbi:MAG: nitroreductase family protein [Candidatus Bipolaricaulis sp.]|nr:nitroreductase family protein [Candidatus Bipolaricaulis sp.]